MRTHEGQAPLELLGSTSRERRAELLGERTGRAGLGRGVPFLRIATDDRQRPAQTGVVVGARDRLIGSAQLSVYLSQGAALHVRLGAYADSWHVLGIIPEFLVAKELAQRGLLTFRYRFYKQGPASFYLPRYPDLTPLMSGDERLGPIKENALGTELRWRVLGAAGGFGALTLTGSYDVSFLDYELLNTATIRGQVVSLSLTGSY